MKYENRQKKARPVLINFIKPMKTHNVRLKCYFDKFLDHQVR
jgi:hypothetical protein